MAAVPALVLLVSVLITRSVLIIAGENITSQHYHIVPVNSTDLCQPYQAESCLTLDQLLSQIDTRDISNLILSFIHGDHLLTRDLTIDGLHTITLKSDNSRGSFDHPRITCSEDKTITIKKTNLLIIQDIEIHGCLSNHNSIIHLTETSAKIYNCIFKNNSNTRNGGGGSVIKIESSDLCHIESSFFKSSNGDSGGAIHLQNTATTIINTSFEETTAYEGGALFIENNIIGTLTTTILGSMFINNSVKEIGGAISAAGILYLVKNIYKHNKAQLGGAIVNFDTNGGTNSTEEIFEGNDAHEGSALYLRSVFEVTLINCTITRNLGFSSAVYVEQQSTLTFMKDNYLMNNMGSLYIYYSKLLIIGDILFRNNSGVNGGAMTSIASFITLNHNSHTIISKNRASISGGGLYLKQSTLNAFGTLNITDNTAEHDGGGIYTFKTTATFSDRTKTIIKNNTAKEDGGGMYLFISSLTINTQLLSVTDNTAGQYGGGIFTDLLSEIIIHCSYIFSEKTNIINVISNKAIKGGGLYMSYIAEKGLCERRKRNCVFDIENRCLDNPQYYKLLALKVDFYNNTALQTGSDIYGGLLDRCIIDKNYTGLNIIGHFDWDKTPQIVIQVGKVKNTPSLHNHISSDPVRVCICENDAMNCTISPPTMCKRKGERFTMSLVITDQVGRPLNATLISTLKQEDGNVGRLKEGQNYRYMKDQCTEMEFNVYSDQTHEVIEIYADGPCGNKGLSKLNLTVAFSLCTCPVGLQRIPPDIDCKCDCDRRLSDYISNCSVETATVVVNSNTWIRYINNTNSTVYSYITCTCPFDYCVNKPFNLSLAKEDEQCAFNRTGTICGECKQGLSLVFASSDCQKCSNYYLFLLLPFAVAGIALVAFILILNMTVATGTIHGLIFYANILAANRSIFLPFSSPNFLTVFVSWLNLDLGIKTCFYSGMDSYGKLLLQLVFPAYLFFLIVIIMILCNHSHRIAQLFGKRNPEATLHTIILLSFSKLTQLIITALQFTKIRYPDGTQDIVWLYDANILYFTVSHIPRFIAAVIIILLGAIYTTLLLFGQLFNRCSGYRVMKWTTHKYYIHFLKAHHAPFSDSRRYWMGLLLLARLTHYLMSAFVADMVAILSACSITILLTLFKLLGSKIYRARWLDSLESLFLVNLTVLGLATLFIRDTTGSQQALATVSMSLTFTAFLGLVLYHTLHTCGLKLGEVHIKIIAALRRHRQYELVTIKEVKREEEYLDDEPLSELEDMQNDRDNSDVDPDRYITPPIIRSAVHYDQLREPALDVLSPVRPEDYIS